MIGPILRILYQFLIFFIVNLRRENKNERIHKSGSTSSTNKHKIEIDELRNNRDRRLAKQSNNNI
jgi:hypothetical protein